MAQVPHVKEQIERHGVFLKHLQTPKDIGADDEIVIRLVLRDMADTDEARIILELEQLLLTTITGQIHPADNPRDEGVFLRQAQRPASLLQIVLGLHEYGALYPNRAELWFEVFGQEVPADRRVLGRFQPAEV